MFQSEQRFFQVYSDVSKLISCFQINIDVSKLCFQVNYNPLDTVTEFLSEILPYENVNVQIE